MNSSKTRVTLKDIAEKCGYSVNTVSRALRSDTGLPEETIRKIRETAREAGYIRNNLASTLRSGKSNVIAIVIEDLQNQHYSWLLNKLSRRLSENGYQVMILMNRSGHHSDLQQEENDTLQVVSYAISHAVDGVICFPPRAGGQAAAAILRNSIPLVLVDREIDGIRADIARVDDYEGGRLAANILYGLGHRKIVYIAGPKSNGSQILREKGFLEVMAEKGIKKEEILILPHSAVMQAIEQQTLDELLFPVDYTGIFSFNDQMAYYAMNCLRENGIRIPEDVSILGFDNIYSRFPYMMPLSTIAEQTGTSLAKEAVRLLLERIDDPELPPRSVILAPQYFDMGTAAAVLPQEGV